MEKFQFPDEKPDEIQVDVEGSNEIEIEVVDDTPEKDKGRKALDKPVEEPNDDELESYSEKVQARIKELTHARHDERRQKEALLREKQELENVARRLMEETRQLKQYVSTGEQQFVETYKDGAVRELEIAKRAYKDAYEAGDADALVAAQEALTEAKFKLQKAQNFRPTPLQTEEPVVQRQPIAQSTPEIDEKTAKWQEQNQWFGAPGHEEMTSFSLGLHQKLVNSGVDPSSDEYFERINARMRAVFPDYFGEKDEGKPKASPGSKKPSTVVAPSARSTGVKKVQLTATQVALAKRLGLTNQQYAIELLKLENANG